MMRVNQLSTSLQALVKHCRKLSGKVSISKQGEVTWEVAADDLISVCQELQDHKDCRFEQLIDLCGVDYLQYGLDEWASNTVANEGFSRGVHPLATPSKKEPRFAVVYHLLSVSLNHRIRLKVMLKSDQLVLPSVTDLWPAAMWFEREAYDLFGIRFEGNRDLRRLLTDYGFVGHPLRKDFPLSGEVEMRYDKTQGRCVLEPVDITPRVTVPRVIRDDSRYEAEDGEA